MGHRKRHLVQLVRRAFNRNDEAQTNRGRAGRVLAAAELASPIWSRKGVLEESASPRRTRRRMGPAQRLHRAVLANEPVPPLHLPIPAT
jgi:hypothetical protein